jgi:hypothetical protein
MSFLRGDMNGGCSGGKQKSERAAADRSASQADRSAGRRSADQPAPHTTNMNSDIRHSVACTLQQQGDEHISEQHEFRCSRMVVHADGGEKTAKRSNSSAQPAHFFVTLQLTRCVSERCDVRQ